MMYWFDYVHYMKIIERSKGISDKNKKCHKEMKKR